MDKLIEWIKEELNSTQDVEQDACDYVRGSNNGKIHGLKLALIKAKHIKTIEELESQRLKAFHNYNK